MELTAGYKATEVGAIPEEWDVVSVGQMGQVLTGKALAVNAPGKQRPYLRTKNVFDGRIDIDNNPAERTLRGIAVTVEKFLRQGCARI